MATSAPARSVAFASVIAAAGIVILLGLMGFIGSSWIKRRLTPMPRTAAELETTFFHVRRVSLSLLMSNFAQALNADAIML